MPRIGRALPKTLSVDQVDRLSLRRRRPMCLAARSRDAGTDVRPGLRVRNWSSCATMKSIWSTASWRLIGKGGKERLGADREAAIDALRAWLRHGARNCPDQNRPTGFPDAPRRGDDTPELLALIKRHAVAAGIHSALSPHTLRHAFATHLLERRCRSARGADLLRPCRSVDHADLHATSPAHGFKEIHAKHHPRA